jgi:hypothetical protein
MANRQVSRRLSEDEMNRGIGMFEAGRSQRHVAYVLGVSQRVVSRMSNRFQIIEMSCRATPEVGNVEQLKPIYCPSDQAPTVLERYDLTFRLQECNWCAC